MADDDHSMSEFGSPGVTGADEHDEPQAGADQPDRRSRSRALRRRVREQIKRLITAIREGDEHAVEAAIIQLSQTRRFLAPLGFIVGAFVMLFSGLKLLFSNLRLALVQLLPAMWIWVVMLDWKVHVLHGKQYHAIRGPIVLLILAGVVLITAASFYLNAVFAYAVASSGSPDIRAGFTQYEGQGTHRSRVGRGGRSGCGRRDHPGATVGSSVVRAACRNRDRRDDDLLYGGARPPDRSHQGSGLLARQAGSEPRSVERSGRPSVRRPT